MRRTMLRYINLCLILTFTMISPQARSRFPTMEHLVEGGNFSQTILILVTYVIVFKV